MTSPLIPGAAVLSRPLEAGEMATFSCKLTNHLVPGAVLLSRPLEADEMVTTSNILTSILAPFTAVLPKQLESLKLLLLGCYCACVRRNGTAVISLLPSG